MCLWRRVGVLLKGGASLLAGSQPASHRASALPRPCLLGPPPRRVWCLAGTQEDRPAGVLWRGHAWHCALRGQVHSRWRQLHRGWPQTARPQRPHQRRPLNWLCLVDHRLPWPLAEGRATLAGRASARARRRHLAPRATWLRTLGRWLAHCRRWPLAGRAGCLPCRAARQCSLLATRERSCWTLPPRRCPCCPSAVAGGLPHRWPELLLLEEVPGHPAGAPARRAGADHLRGEPASLGWGCLLVAGTSSAASGACLAVCWAGAAAGGSCRIAGGAARGRPLEPWSHEHTLRKGCERGVAGGCPTVWCSPPSELASKAGTACSTQGRGAHLEDMHVLMIPLVRNCPIQQDAVSP